MKSIRDFLKSDSVDKILSPDFTTVYSFGSHSDRNYGELVLSADGKLIGYQHPNENGWIMDESQLCLINESQEISSRFSFSTANNLIGHAINTKWPMYLLPLISLDKNDAAKDFSHCFYVNTVPKSGTYFLEAALSNIGVTSTRLHLSGRDTVHDYRSLPDELIHVKPEMSYLRCPAELVAAIAKGRTVVGHIEHPDVINKIKAQGAIVFNIYRDLRDVLVSLYRFKLNKVASKGADDDYWRQMPEGMRFTAFLLSYSGKDIEHIKRVAQLIADDGENIKLSYEDMCQGTINADARSKLNEYYPGLVANIEVALKDQYGKSNPTFSGKRSSWQDVWNEDAEIFFSISGLKEVNNALGYH